MSVGILKDIAQRKLDQARRIPKVELHRHLEGAVRFSTAVELCMKKGYDLPYSLEEELKDALLVRRPLSDLKSVLDRFWTTQSLLDSSQVLERVAFEAIEDAYQEGIRVLELRFSFSFIQKNHEHLSYDQILKGILDGKSKAQSRYPIAVGLISIIGRVDSPEVQASVMDFTCENAAVLHGVDLADNEVGLDAMTLVPLFERAKKAGLRITIHAGEQLGTQQNIYDSIKLLGAERIGHGIQIMSSPELLEFARTQNVIFEVCPISNWMTHNIPGFHQHPIVQMIESGLKVTVNSDDPGIFDTSLSLDYAVLEDAYGFDTATFKKLNQTAFEASFVPLAERLKVRPEFQF